MKIKNLLLLIASTIFAAILLLLSWNKDNKNVKSDVIMIVYKKDQNGNCYAYQPNTPKFSWIPCELTK